MPRSLWEYSFKTLEQRDRSSLSHGCFADHDYRSSFYPTTLLPLEKRRVHWLIRPDERRWKALLDFFNAVFEVKRLTNQLKRPVSLIDGNRHYHCIVRFLLIEELIFSGYVILSSISGIHPGQFAHQMAMGADTTNSVMTDGREAGEGACAHPTSISTLNKDELFPLLTAWRVDCSDRL